MIHGERLERPGYIYPIDDWRMVERTLDEFTDVREIQAVLEKRGLELAGTADPGSSGPAHISLVDPDGNAILIDQFF